MALTETGFNRPTYDELLEQQLIRAKQLFGEDIDVSDISTLGKYIRLNVSDIDTLYQTLEGVYYARFPNTANGVSLDRLCPLAGITRRAATYARHTVVFTGDVGAEIPAGLEVCTANQSVIFHVVDACVVGSNGTVSTLVECNEAGTIGNIASSYINTLLNTATDLEGVQGTAVNNYGEERESDASLRQRFAASITGAGSGTAAAICGAIMRVDGVDGCNIVENATDETSNGIPPHSFKCYVSSDELTATDLAVAKAIFAKKPIGIKSVGTVAVQVTDDGGNNHTINFERTTRKTVYVKITLSKNNFFEDDGVDQIKNNIVNYLSTFTNGTDVYLSALYSYINITGVVNVSSLQLSTDGTNYSASNIICSDNEIARTSVSNITITVQ